MLAPLPTSDITATPGGLSLQRTASRTATLSDPANLLSLTSQTDAVNVNDRTYLRKFDASANARTITSTSPEGRSVTMTMDALGRTTKSEIPGLAPVNYTYDARGRIAAITQGAGADSRTTSFSYDANTGYLASSTNPLGQTAGFVHDVSGRTVSMTGFDNAETQYGYDNNGNRTSITTPGGNVHLFTFNSIDLHSSYTPPFADGVYSGMTYAYNLDRDLVSVTYPDANLTTFAYDQSTGKLSTITIPDNAFAYGYEPSSGYLNSLSNSDGIALSMKYDGTLETMRSWSGLISNTINFAYDINYAYDNDYRLTSMKVTGSDPIMFSYDKDSLITKVGDLSISRDANTGFPINTTIDNISDEWIYSNFGEVTGYTASIAGSPLISIQYSYDKLGRITKKTETYNSVTTEFDYEYDAAGRLTKVAQNGITVTVYAYDLNGNRLSKVSSGGTLTGVYDKQDRLTSFGSTIYQYTANGDLLRKSDGAQAETYQYDLMGNLRKVALPDGNTTIEYVLGGTNRRMGKKVNGALVQGFLYQGDFKPAAELDSNMNIVSLFIYGPQGGAPDYMIKNNVKYRIIKDILGSPRFVVNTSTGEIAQMLDYDEFGQVLVDSNPGFQPFGFAGGIYDPDTGLIRFGLRDYDPWTGRWTAKDPLLFGGRSANLYAYVDNAPLARKDPSGAFYVAVSYTLAAQFLNVAGSWDPVGYYFGDRTRKNCPQSDRWVVSKFKSSGGQTGASLGAQLSPIGGTVAFSPFGTDSDFEGDSDSLTLGLGAILGFDITLSAPRVTPYQTTMTVYDYNNHPHTTEVTAYTHNFSHGAISVTPSVDLGAHISVFAVGASHTDITYDYPEEKHQYSAFR